MKIPDALVRMLTVQTPDYPASSAQIVASGVDEILGSQPQALTPAVQSHVVDGLNALFADAPKLGQQFAALLKNPAMMERYPELMRFIQSLTVVADGADESKVKNWNQQQQQAVKTLLQSYGVDSAVRNTPSASLSGTNVQQLFDALGELHEAIQQVSSNQKNPVAPQVGVKNGEVKGQSIQQPGVEKPSTYNVADTLTVRTETVPVTAGVQPTTKPPGTTLQSLGATQEHGVTQPWVRNLATPPLMETGIMLVKGEVQPTATRLGGEVQPTATRLGGEIKLTVPAYAVGARENVLVVDGRMTVPRTDLEQVDQLLKQNVDDLVAVLSQPGEIGELQDSGGVKNSSQTQPLRALLSPTVPLEKMEALLPAVEKVLQQANQELAPLLRGAVQQTVHGIEAHGTNPMNEIKNYLNSLQVIYTQLSSLTSLVGGQNVERQKPEEADRFLELFFSMQSLGGDEGASAETGTVRRWASQNSKMWPDDLRKQLFTYYRPGNQSDARVQKQSVPVWGETATTTQWSDERITTLVSRLMQQLNTGEMVKGKQPEKTALATFLQQLATSDDAQFTNIATRLSQDNELPSAQQQEIVQTAKQLLSYFFSCGVQEPQELKLMIRYVLLALSDKPDGGQSPDKQNNKMRTAAEASQPDTQEKPLPVSVSPQSTVYQPMRAEPTTIPVEVRDILQQLTLQVQSDPSQHSDSNISNQQYLLQIPVQSEGAYHTVYCLVNREQNKSGQSQDEMIRLRLLMETSHLGTVDVSLVSRGQAVNVHFKLPDVQTEQLFQTMLPQLYGQLERQGRTTNITAKVHNRTQKPDGRNAGMVDNLVDAKA